MVKGKNIYYFPWGFIPVTERHRHDIQFYRYASHNKSGIPDKPHRLDAQNNVRPIEFTWYILMTAGILNKFPFSWLMGTWIAIPIPEPYGQHFIEEYRFPFGDGDHPATRVFANAFTKKGSFVYSIIWFIPWIGERYEKTEMSSIFCWILIIIMF